MTVNTPAFTLAVSNRKGGSGKTTTAVNLAAELARRGRRVLLVDADSQSHCAVGLGIDSTTQCGSLHDLFRSTTVDPATLVQPTDVPNLYLVPADPRFDGQLAFNGDDRLATALAEVQGEYDNIIIDTPPSIDTLLRNALHAANGILIPLVPQVLGQAGVRQLAQLFYQVASSVRSPMALLGLLPVMCDRRVPSQQRILDELALTFGRHRLLRSIRNDVRVAEAFGSGQPICHYAARSRGAMDYFMLAEALWPVLTEQMLTTQDN